MMVHLSDGVSDTSDTLSSLLDAESGTASGLLVEDFSDS